MFDKIKQLRELQKQAKNVQKTLAEEIITIEREGVKIRMNGNMEVLSLKIESEKKPEELAKIIKKVVNSAIKETQKMMAKKMLNSGINFPGLS